MSTLTYLDIPHLAKDLQEAKKPKVIMMGGREVMVGTDPSKWHEVNKIVTDIAQKVKA